MESSATRLLSAAVLVAIVLGGGCGGNGHANADLATSDASSFDDAAVTDAAIPALVACPPAVIKAPGHCYTVLPSSLGLGGENAADPSIALTPASNATPRNQLVLFLNGTNGHPRDDIPASSPTVNFYDTAASLGYSVLAVSYRSIKTVNNLCTPNGAMSPDESCLFPTRETLVRGVYQTGAAAGVQDIMVQESIAGRTLATLRYLAQADPGHGWEAYFTTTNPSAPPEAQIVWDKIVSAGHSQGGGHAAVLGKLFPVARVVQLSATCDAYGTSPSTAIAASWTNGATTPWGSDPSQFWGLGVKTTFTDGMPSGGDVNCYTHLIVWQNLGMLTSHQNDAAVTCSQVSTAHDATIGCPGNAAAWQSMLQ